MATNRLVVASALASHSNGSVLDPLHRRGLSVRDPTDKGGCDGSAEEFAAGRVHGLISDWLPSIYHRRGKAESFGFATVTAAETGRFLKELCLGVRFRSLRAVSISPLFLEGTRNIELWRSHVREKHG